MNYKLPRSYAEAVEFHPGISHIEDEREAAHKSPDGTWDSVPFLCYLNPGWTWEDLTAFGFYGLSDLKENYWDSIVYGPKQEE